MGKRLWLAAGAASGIGTLSLALSSGVLLLANKFIEDMTKPHATLDNAGDLWGIWGVPDPEPDPPAELRRPVTFQAPHGPWLRGEFWAQPQPAPTIVICHGFRVSGERLHSVATLEYKHGFNVMCFDFRGHGTSDAAPTTGGNAEVADLLAALEIARAQPEMIPGEIFLHGFSMGASVALLLPPTPDVAAIIADSPFARLDEILERLVMWQLNVESAHWRPAFRGLSRAFRAISRITVSASVVLFRLRFHSALIARPDLRLRRSAQWHGKDAPPRPVPILLIHALGDSLVPFAHARALVEACKAARVPLEMHFVKSDVHCGAYAQDPAAYLTVLKRFVARHRQPALA